MKPVSSTLATVLRSGRAEFNTRFAAARHLHPRLNGEAFTQFLETAVDELAQAIERVRADRLGEVVQAAYDAALELVGQELVGPAARHPFIEESWRRILPKVSALVASEPTQVIAAVCNAAHQLASVPDTRPAQWIDLMETLTSECPDAETLLKLGQVIGWRAGLAHYRPSALAVADALPQNLALAAVGARSNTGWAAVSAQLRSNPWYDPASETAASSSVRVVAQPGAFRGFGGLFVEPPIVAVAGEHFLVRSADDCWLLTADVFGATFHRAPVGEFESADRRPALPAGLKVNGARIEFRGQPFEFSALGEFTSVAANPTTLALTGRFTHSVVLIALS